LKSVHVTALVSQLPYVVEHEATQTGKRVVTNLVLTESNVDDRRDDLVGVVIAGELQRPCLEPEKQGGEPIAGNGISGDREKLTGTFGETF
jgi:hypothetical protein